MSDLTTTHPTLTLSGARTVLDSALAKAEQLGVHVNVAVVDRSGGLLVFARMDGAPTLSAQIAQDKAWTVTSFSGVPTHAWYDLIRDDPALLAGIVHTERLVIFGGGVPVLVDGHVVGAVGVSGGSAEQDRAVAEAGAGAAA